jgi:hypothetical protein
MPGARRARSPACSVESTRGSHHGHAGTPGIPRAMVLTVSFAFSPATNSSCHRRAMLSGRIGFDSTGSPLAPATGVRTARLRRTHPASSSAFLSSRSRTRKCPPCPAQSPRRRRARPPHPAPRFVTIASRPSCGAGRRVKATDLPRNESGKFFAKGLDRFLLICPASYSDAAIFSSPGLTRPARDRGRGSRRSGTSH